MEEKKKKPKNDCEESSEEEEGPCKSGYQLVERVGVCYAFCNGASRYFSFLKFTFNKNYIIFY